MKFIAGFLAPLIFATTAIAAAEDSIPQSKSQHGMLAIEVTGLPNADGNIQVALWKNGDGFPADTKLSWRQATGKIAGTKSRIEFHNVEYGRYAVSLYHDANSNEKLDRNFLKIPKEGVGASNNRVGRFSAPKFQAAQFDIQEPKKALSIKLHHF